MGKITIKKVKSNCDKNKNKNKMKMNETCLSYVHRKVAEEIGNCVMRIDIMFYILDLAHHHQHKSNTFTRLNGNTCK